MLGNFTQSFRDGRIRGEIEQLRLFALARLKRTVEADAALARWSVLEPDAVYRESLVPLWLGRKDAAIARLEKGLADAESADRGVLYKVACAAALFAASETLTMEEKHGWMDRSVILLERWSQRDQSYRNQIVFDPDLLALRSDPRFGQLATERSSNPEQPYWLANREVTRSEFEAFVNDTS